MRILLLVFFLLPFSLIAQEKMENDLDQAFQNAKKGIYWALSNIPENKIRLNIDLIADERLYSSVKLQKEFNGIKIVSTGFFNSTEVSIIIYRSNDGLVKDGYLKMPETEEEKD